MAINPLEYTCPTCGSAPYVRCYVGGKATPAPIHKSRMLRAIGEWPEYPVNLSYSEIEYLIDLLKYEVRIRGERKRLYTALLAAKRTVVGT